MLTAEDCCVCTSPEYRGGILCPRHVRVLPDRLTAALIDTCDRGRMPPSQAHLDVVAECVRTVGQG